MNDLSTLALTGQSLTLSSVPAGYDAIVTADLARARAGALSGRARLLCHIARDEVRLRSLVAEFAFVAPDIEIVALPAWDCLPYDRVGPNPGVESARIAALSRLAEIGQGEGETSTPLIVVTTVSAALQRVPSRREMRARSWSAQVGQMVDTAALVDFLEANGYARASTVVEPGEYAVRGGIIDIYPSGAQAPARLDFFGKTLESVRSFDAETQRTTVQLRDIALHPVSEVVIDAGVIARFRQGYVSAFGAVTGTDPLYEAVSAGRRHRGMEHWLPLFHGKLETVFDVIGDGLISLDPLAEAAARERLDQIKDHYGNRSKALGEDSFGAPPYKPLPPEALYLTTAEWEKRLAGAVIHFNPFAVPQTDAAGEVVDLGARVGRNFANERAADAGQVFDAVVAHVRELAKAGKRVLITAAGDGPRDRLATLLQDHGLAETRTVENLTGAASLPSGAIGFATFAIEAGFEAGGLVVLSEGDILGERLIRSRGRARKAQDFLTELTALTPGDLVVHVDHGIGRFAGLKSVDAAGAPHDCLEIHYHGSDKLYLPVENIELLSRFGSDGSAAQLDRLGGAGWQARKAKAKKRINDMAGELIKIAAARALRQAPRMTPDPGLEDEFRARFPFVETEDQEGAIAAVAEDLASGRAMDRLICGDVGFGKTEVALRSAFVAVSAGFQVAVIVPTTLLARQHYLTFATRFEGLPITIGRASRLVGSKELSRTRAGLAEGRVDIIIGTHALLGKAIRFKNLGLVVVDEEQHFGVAHKEKLKALRNDVHVLTLTATPIPRTLQLALTGVRDLSIIATPPVDRLAVRTFIAPFDPVVVREALLRELYRGGQSFFVCPRIKDLSRAAEFLAEYVPEVKFVTGHGQLPPTELDDVMNAFYEGRYDVLLSTAIVESGLDIPSANTLIVFRADRFGLSQMYQLRGRVGRSKTRAYALFTVPPNRQLTPAAEKRLKVLQSLDSLGAGFNLASHDLDIRGAGNLLGDEQSGHIREVGFELYQSMLEEAVAALREGGQEDTDRAQWSPQISLGASVLIPETFVSDLQLRLGLYRRLSNLHEPDEIDGFAAELVDRFGPLPEEVEHLLRVVSIKMLCRRANISRLDAGPKGAVITFRDDIFANPEGLLRWIQGLGVVTKIRPDQKLVVQRGWDDADARIRGAEALVRQIAKIAEAATAMA
ncbi:Transcription-repair coupling factor [hydrothermal vent metagenome]|uniref:Transcription-repair coupling factor n=1 Tax=hydrothermal vent metagenome TaxID=652676 RepID=A0A3B0T520_9ZZZZ